jgi:TolB-like protein/tetratricopeptide (TPR) repeat protein
MNNLFNELRRRNVFRVAGVYAVVGWLLAQVAATLENAIGLPAWFDGFVVATLLIGFPIAMILAWAFEMTPEGMKPTASVPEGQSIHAKTGRTLDYVIIGGLALVAVMIIADRMMPSVDTRGANASQDEAGAQATDASIAVLPFADLSPAGDQEYFSDGMAEEILNVLAKVKGLDVASRTSSFQFKGRELGVPEIAKQLNVRHVLEGSVRKAGDTLRITAQLIDTQTDRHLWSETYDRPLTTQNVFTIQDEIATAIVDALDGAMGVETAPKISVSQVTDNLTAYELYLQARGYFVARHQLDKADALLIRALEQDPEFAKAWEIHAALQSLLLEYGYVKTPREEVEKRTLEYAQRALTLDPQSATAIAALAKLKLNAAQKGREKADYSEVLSDFDRALNIEPRNASALLWRGMAYADVGDFEASLASFTQCVELEPYYVPCTENRMALLSGMGRDDEALKFYEQALNTSAAKIIFAPFATLARRGEKLAFMSATNSPDLFLGWRRHEELYEAIRNPGLTYPDLVADIHRFQAQTRQTGEQDFTFFLAALGDYDTTPFTVDYWGANFTGYRKSAQFKSLIKNFGVLDYWRAHGFPPQCRAAGKDDFECE